MKNGKIPARQLALAQDEEPGGPGGEAQGPGGLGQTEVAMIAGLRTHIRGSQLIKVRLVCDTCGAVISDGISANEVRFQAEALYRRREGNDLCLTCAGDAPTAPPPSERPHKAPRQRP